MVLKGAGWVLADKSTPEWCTDADPAEIVSIPREGHITSADIYPSIGICSIMIDIHAAAVNNHLSHSWMAMVINRDDELFHVAQTSHKF